MHTQILLVPRIQKAAVSGLAHPFTAKAPHGHGPNQGGQAATATEARTSDLIMKIFGRNNGIRRTLTKITTFTLRILILLALLPRMSTASSHDWISWDVALIGEGFQVPQDTVVRYVTKDWAGETESHGMLSSNALGAVTINVSLNTAYIDLAIGGSDGFEPVYFQPFDYVYNVTHVDQGRLEIPVKSWKNVIVSLKDAFTGEEIESGFIKFPEDAIDPRAGWYDQRWMPNSHSAYVDDQAMAFFQLEPDLFIPIQASAPGYKTWNSRISVASNTTHLVEANLHKYIDVTLKVLDKDPRSRLHRKVPHARVEIGLDDRGVTELTTDKNGEATFQASTDLQRLSLRITDASEVHQPSFELHDAENFLKEGEVHIELLERSHTLTLATASCAAHFKHFGHVSVIFKIDEHTQFHRSSDEHGLIHLTITESTNNITAHVIQASQPHHDLVGLWPLNDWPERFNFKFSTSRVLASLKLTDLYNDRKTAAYATIRVHLMPSDEVFEVVTNHQGRTKIEIPSNTTNIALQLLDDGNDDIVEPGFDLYDDCSNFFELNKVDIEILERMYTVHIATASCQDLHHYADVPVLVHLCYGDQEDSCQHVNIHEHVVNNPRQWLQEAPLGPDPRKHLRTFVQTSDSHGHLRLRMHSSVSNVTLTVLEAPRGQEHVGLMPREDLPEHISFVFFSLPQKVTIDVRDELTHVGLLGAPVHVKYFDPMTDDDRTVTTLTDPDGKAVVALDGCIEFASFTVSSPSRPTCDGLRYEEEKIHHWNIMDRKSVRVHLKLATAQHREITLQIKTPDDVRSHMIDQMTYTTDVDQDSTRLVQKHHDWSLKIRQSDRRLHVLTQVKRHHLLGLTSFDILGNLVDDDVISLFHRSVKVTLKLRDSGGHSQGGVDIHWHVGLGLGTHTIVTSSDHGEATIYAPRGYLLAIEVPGFVGCHFPLQVFEVDHRHHKRLTLTC